MTIREPVGFVEYYRRYYHDVRGRFTKQPRRIKLPPFFRTSRGYDIYATSSRESPEHFKIIGTVITTYKPFPVSKLDTWMANELNTYFNEKGFDRWWQENAKAVEIEQISRYEISPHRLFRAYLYIDDVKVASEDMY